MVVRFDLSRQILDFLYIGIGYLFVMCIMREHSKSKARAVWKFSSLLLSIFLLMACESGNGHEESLSISPESDVSVRRKIKIPGEMEVKNLVGNAKFKFPGEYQDAIAISDRILDGFQAAPSQLIAESGVSILWGFKFGEGNLQSIMVLDADGGLVLGGVVDNIVRLVDGPSSVVSSMGQYQDKVKSVHAEPAAVTLFVSKESDLVKYLPLVKRWIQANFLGMNVSCEEGVYKPACALLPYVDVPVSAYVKQEERRGDGLVVEKIVELQVPESLPAEIPLEKFKQ